MQEIKSILKKIFECSQSAIANQLDWSEINEIIQDAKDDGHSVALAIKELQLDTNHILMTLR